MKILCSFCLFSVFNLISLLPLSWAEEKKITKLEDNVKLFLSEPYVEFAKQTPSFYAKSANGLQQEVYYAIGR